MITKPKNSYLYNIWKKVPPNYYQEGIKTNLLQRLWHEKKLETLSLLTAQLQPHKILDVGCASGMMTNKILKLFPKSKVIGVDAYKEAITYAKKKYPHVVFLVADAHELPFNKNTFDLCICYETIEHVENPQKMLQEIGRVIKRNGKAIVAMDSGSLLFKIVWWFWEKTKGKVWQGAHLHPFTYNELEQTIKEAGFNIEKKHFSHSGMEVSFLLSK